MRKLIFVTFAVLLLSAADGARCGSNKHPIVKALGKQDPRTPVVLIPGITGSKLRDVATGKTIWGRAGNLMGPRDGGRRLGLPIVDTPAPGEVVEAFEIIEKIGGVKIYSRFVETLRRNGYVRGNLLDPRPEDTLLVFPYDWRYGSVEAAGVLAERLEQLRQVRGDDVLRVALVCHSNAARIARWYVKFGGGSLEDAEAGRARRPSNVIVEKIVFAATGQAGALPTLRSLDRGRRYVPLGRALRPEYLFTMPGLFEALPAYRDDLFFDAEGETLAVDLFDATSWETYGWSIFGAESRRRVGKLGADDAVLATAAERRAWLETRLDVARRIQAVLMRDVRDFPDVRLYQVQGTYRETPSRALLVQDADGVWETLTILDKRLRKQPWLRTIATAPGDRHATRESQDRLSPQERDAVAGTEYTVDTVHRMLLNDWLARRRILEFLAD